MCTGLEIAAIAASTGGAFLNSQIQNDAISEQNRQNQIAMDIERAARSEEVRRQQKMEAAQADQVAQALFEVAPESVVEEAAAEAAAPDNATVAAADEYNLPSLQGQVENENVTESIGETVAKAARKTRGMLENAALLTAQGNSFSNAMNSLGRMSSEIQTIGGNRRGSSNVAQLETSIPAAQVTPSQSLIGDLLMMGGQAVGGAAGQRMGASGARKPFDLGSIFKPIQPRAPYNAIPSLGPVTV